MRLRRKSSAVGLTKETLRRYHRPYWHVTETTMNTASHPTAVSALSADKAERAGALYAVFAAVLLGIVLIAGSGFAGPKVLHNAAHDSRHANVFPCH